MSEAGALLALYGAIDRAVVAGEADVESLGQLLGPYRGGAAIGWYDRQYLPWLEGAKERAALRAREKAVSDDEPRLAYTDSAEQYAEAVPQDDGEAHPLKRATLSPRAQEVADALATFESRRLEGRVGARRLLAVAAAARALPQHFGPNGSHADIANLPLVFQHPELDGDSSRRAELLHARVATDFRSMADWPQVVQASVATNLVPESFRSQAGAPPCTGRLILVPDPDGTDPDPCTVLEAEFTTTGAKDDPTFEEIKRYLVPSNWPLVPDSLWCRMDTTDPLGKNPVLYHETVATSCSPSPGGWTVSTDLHFWFSHPTPDEARVEYDLPPWLPVATSDIEVDEGSLRVIRLPDNRVNVKTTKRVRFTGAFDGAGLAMLMCATGYSSAMEDMVFAVANLASTQTTPFPVPAPSGPPQGGTVSPPTNPKKTAKTTAKTTAKKSASSSKTSAGDEAGDETLDDIAADAAKLFESYLKDYVATCTSSLERIQKGTYKVEDAWSDGISLWTKYLSGLGNVMDLGTRTAKAAAKNPPSTDEA